MSAEAQKCMKFRIGDVCIVRANAVEKTLIGEEVCITEEEALRADGNGGRLAYGITPIRSNSVQFLYAEHCVLMLKRPKSWDKFLFDTSSVKDEKIEHVKERA